MNGYSFIKMNVKYINNICNGKIIPPCTVIRRTAEIERGKLEKSCVENPGGNKSKKQTFQGIY